MSASLPETLTTAGLDGVDGVFHAFFTRRGGVSDGIYASLNCGLGSGDDPERVRENRRRAAAASRLPKGELMTAYQVHSPTPVIVGDPWGEDDRPKADALVTRRRGLLLGVLTADCAPVLLADRRAGVIAAAHAGWRGALTGILEATVDAMESLGATRETIVAGIGPCIARASYEVGPEFPGPFLEQSIENRDFFEDAPRAGYFLFDLQGYVARRLGRMGLREVEALLRDTRAEEDAFFSHRRARLRDEHDYGRNLSAICLAP